MAFPDPTPTPGPHVRFILCYVLPVLLGFVAVGSLAKAGFLKAEWLGYILLALGCFVLMMVLMALGRE